MKTICDYTITSERHRSRDRWHPGILFAGGAAGAWFDPSDLSTLFQDSAGTTPVTASGQPVGRMSDKSGNGHHATQSVSTGRPTYRNADGRHWLEFDGVDDRMAMAATLDLDAGQIVAGLVEPAGLSANAGLLSASAGGYVAMTGNGGDRSLAKNDGGINIRVDTPAHFPMTDNSAVAIRVEGTTIHARRWGSQTEYHNDTPGRAGLGSTSVLMAFSAAGALAARVDLFGLLLLPAPLQSGELENSIAYVSARMAQ